MKKSLSYILLIIAIFVIGANRLSAQMEFTPDVKLRYANGLIENFYVEEVNNDSIVTEAIIAMLKTLDPHSAYSSPEETKELNQPLEGKFSGIGIQFNLVRDTIYVVQTTVGGPSEKVGLRPGDRIIYANDTLLAGQKFKNTDVVKHLRGPKGSVVNIKVKRGDSPDLIDFVIIRDDIPIYSVDASYMADPTTGYIHISRFAQDTDREVVEAIDKLRAQGMKNLIIDLQDNGGGYLGSAFQLGSEFLDKGDTVVYTMGRNSEPAYFTSDQDGRFGDGRLVIMVNQYSASASEILSGAIQDYDRGIIVGRRTFGKGLVQRPFPFPDGSMIRLTTARYYTPSGRCIQKPYAKGQSEEYQLDLLNRYKSGELWSADSIKIDTTQVYHTLHNRRTVYGGGGILPDIFVPVDTSYYSTYYRDIVAKGTVNQFCINYIDKNRAELLKKYPDNEAFFRNFEVSDDILDQLIERATSDSIKFNQEQFDTSKPYISAIIKGIFSRDLYEDGNYYRAVNHLDPVFRQALDIINDPKRYNSLLHRKKILFND